MTRTTVNLVSEAPGSTDAIGNAVPIQTRRTVFAEIGSIGSNEFFRAAQIGLKAQMLVKVFDGDYAGETIVEVNGVDYEAYRTFYDDEEGKYELYLKDKAGVRQ